MTSASLSLPVAAGEPAGQAYHNANVFTAASGAQTATAFAVRDGRLVYVGDEAGLTAYLGPDTVREDLGGRFVMPGLVDGHMHPLSAGTKLLKCSLDYAALTVAELQQRVRGCLEASEDAGPDAWLEVVSWFQEAMRPAGVRTRKADLDVLGTTRPIILRSSFGHTVLANTRALALAGIGKDTPEPLGGKIWREPGGEPTGLLEDSAFEVFDQLLPKPTPEEDAAAARAALAEMARRGVTSFLDTWAPAESIAAFEAAQRAGALSARAHFAVGIEPREAADPAAAVARVAAVARQHDQGTLRPAPGITVRGAKLLLDGVIAAPALTGSMLEPYRVNAGTNEAPHWVPGPSRGPDPYFPPAPLAAILSGLAQAGIDPHLHADGDWAVRAALDGFEAMRKALPGVDVRPAIAHAEIVAREDLPRFAALGTTAVLSLQWGKPAGDTMGLRDHFGPERMAFIEPAGLLAAAGARISMGSDWPVDALDPWFALKVGVTRTAAPGAPPEYAGRLGEDPGLARDAVLRAATIEAAWQLRLEAVAGSLEAGKFADFIVLDRNPLTIAAEDIANVRVLRTVVGGNTVHRATPG
jgi:hypothetical protein